MTKMLENVASVVLYILTARACNACSCRNSFCLSVYFYVPQRMAQ